jgi:hypothetical protein
MTNRHLPYLVPVGRRWPRALAAATLATIAAVLAGCGSSGTPAGSGGSPTGPAATTSPAGTGASSPGQPPVSGSQAPVSAEHNPPGDIPDTTVYVPYQSAAAHAVIKVPEGWARQLTATGATFSSNLNSISIASLPMTASPTVMTARASTVPMLTRANLAFRLQSVKAVRLAGGPAVEIVYQVNSQPNAVTGRQYRLVIERFEFYRNGRGAMLSLSGAVGSDNVDPWRIVSESFRWA